MAELVPVPGGDALQVDLAELEKVWNEVYSRFDNQRQAFNYLVAILGAVAALLASDKFQPQPELFFWLPLVLAPLGFIFFDNELMIWGIVRYSSCHLRTHISRLVRDDEVLLMEKWRFTRPSTQMCHRLLSFGRWALFIIPIIVSTIYAVYSGKVWWKSYYALLFVIDCVAILILLWGMWQAAHEQGITWPRLAHSRRSRV